MANRSEKKTIPIRALTKPEDHDGVLSTRYVDIDTIKYLPDNIKAHDKDAIKGLIRKYGFVNPIGLNRKTGHDIFGNGRLECLREMLSDGEKCPKGIIERFETENRLRSSPKVKKWYVPTVDGLEFDEREELTLAIGMNRSSETGGIDPIKAYPILKRLLETQPEDFERTGYDAGALEHIQRLHRFHSQMKENEAAEERARADRTETPADVSDPDFAAKLNEKWKVSLGDIWQLGDHFLKCGSSSKRSMVKPFIAPDRVRLVCTSPPYDNQRTYQEGGFDWTALMNDTTDVLNEILEAPADIIVNLGPQYKDAQVSFYWNDWLEHCKSDLKMPVYGLYVWDKGFGYPGEYHGRLATSHEYLFHFSLGHTKANKWIETTGATLKRGPNNFSKRKENGSLRPGYTSPEKLAQDHKIPDSVVRLFNEQARGIHTKGHPAVFPVSLPEFIIQTWSQIGEIVFEPFAGSGTTIIACQNLGRRCYAMEISPNYCALILERFSQVFPQTEIKQVDK